MTLKLNIGLSRKVGEPNYGSRGASVNVEMEADSSLVSEPAKLRERIRQLFALVRTSLAEELNGGNGHSNQPLPENPNNGSHSGGNGTAIHNGPGNALPRAATPSQVKALYAISKAQGVNLNQLLRDRFQVGRADDLSLRQASQLIDELKNSAG